MTVHAADRVEAWQVELEMTLADSAALAARGRESFDSDRALPLAFEALCNRVGELCKRLVEAAPESFTHPVWRQAIRNRNFVVHQYHQIDSDALWETVTAGFAELAQELAQRRT